MAHHHGHILHWPACIECPIQHACSKSVYISKEKEVLIRIFDHDIGRFKPHRLFGSLANIHL